MYTFDEIKDTVKDLGFPFYEKGDYNLNFIWLRMDLEITNKFTDYAYCLYYVGGVPQIVEIRATTKPGLKGSIDSPLTVEGVTGTAIIEHTKYYKGGWEFVDRHDKFSSYPYFMQVKGIDYWRDGDKDRMIDISENSADKDAYMATEQKSRIYGTHWHRMSNENTRKTPVDQLQVNNWSLGCMGAPLQEFDKFLAPTREAVKKFGNTFSGSVIYLGDTKLSK